MEDYILRATAAEGSVRAFVATTRNIVKTARKLHNTSPTASAALGRMLTAASMMGIMLKGNNDILTLQIRGTGPIKGIVVTSDSRGRVKGYVFEPDVEIPLNENGKLDVRGAIGDGYLSVIKDMGLKEPYSGQIPLVSGEIAEDLTYYYAKSEQTPSSVGLGVLVDVDTQIKQAGGFIIQLMPDTPDYVIDKLEENINNMTYITSLLDDGKTPEMILEIILKGLEHKILDKVPVEFYCNCSKERVEKALISIGVKDLTEILNEDKKANLHCHFCNKEYKFDENDLTSIINEIM